MDVMTPDHPRWDEFKKRLDSPEGCDFRKDDSGETVWNCAGGECHGGEHNHDLATKILTDMGGFDIEASLEYFAQCGGYCDCEILFNVA